MQIISFLNANESHHLDPKATCTNIYFVYIVDRAYSKKRDQKSSGNCLSFGYKMVRSMGLEPI